MYEAPDFLDQKEIENISNQEVTLPEVPTTIKTPLILINSGMIEDSMFVPVVDPGITNT